MKPTDFAVQLSRYLGAYLLGQSGCSLNTVLSYRDTFTLFLRYCRDEQHLPPQKLTLERIDRHLIEAFLQWVETDRECSTATRNIRLAAIHAFYKYLQIEAPHMLNRCQDILSIPYKKARQKVMSYLTLDEIQALLLQPDVRSRSGRRNLTLLSLLYDTGAHVQELADLKIGDVRFSSPTVIRLTGKGRKFRLVPIMVRTEDLLHSYLEEYEPDYAVYAGYPLFRNRDGKKLTRAGIAYILEKYVSQAQSGGGIPVQTTVSPHVLRHSKAMHLLQSGVNLVYICDLLGHADVSTTEIYARSDAHFKRKALMEAYPSPSPEPEIPAWQKDSDLLSWLKETPNKSTCAGICSAFPLHLLIQV